MHMKRQILGLFLLSNAPADVFAHIADAVSVAQILRLYQIERIDTVSYDFVSKPQEGIHYKIRRQDTKTLLVCNSSANQDGETAAALSSPNQTMPAFTVLAGLFRPAVYREAPPSHRLVHDSSRHPET